MPDQDGVEAHLDLRNSLPDVQIIVISGNAREFLPIAKALGAHRTFAKPFQQAESSKPSHSSSLSSHRHPIT